MNAAAQTSITDRAHAQAEIAHYECAPERRGRRWPYGWAPDWAVDVVEHKRLYRPMTDEEASEFHIEFVREYNRMAAEWEEAEIRRERAEEMAASLRHE